MKFGADGKCNNSNVSLPSRQEDEGVGKTGTTKDRDDGHGGVYEYLRHMLYTGHVRYGAYFLPVFPTRHFRAEVCRGNHKSVTGTQQVHSSVLPVRWEYARCSHMMW